jgi:hypothetical protein
MVKCRLLDLDSSEMSFLRPSVSISLHFQSFTGPLSVINDEELDLIISQLRQQFTRAGITMLHGMLQQLGYRIPRERIRRSLYRIDPVHRIFGRIRIRRRTYSVAGPNSLWHHDGQHGMFILTCVFVKFY